MKVAGKKIRRNVAAQPPKRAGLVVSRKAVVRALSVHGASRERVGELVAIYMGESPVPPAWGRLAVRGTFGSEIERRWSRYVRSRPAAGFRDPAGGGRWVQPFAQTAHDFGVVENATGNPVIKMLRTPSREDIQAALHDRR